MNVHSWDCESGCWGLWRCSHYSDTFYAGRVGSERPAEITSAVSRVAVQIQFLLSAWDAITPKIIRPAGTKASPFFQTFPEVLFRWYKAAAFRFSWKKGPNRARCLIRKVKSWRRGVCWKITLTRCRTNSSINVLLTAWLSGKSFFLPLSLRVKQIIHFVLTFFFSNHTFDYSS